jgi:Ca2+-binding EF-hand superfamily protein
MADNLRDLFTAFDTDGDGLIGEEELNVGVSRLLSVENQ